MNKIDVFSEKCKGCGICVSVCPVKIIRIQKDKRNSKGYFTAICKNQDKCLSCAICGMMCPECAITIRK